MITAQQVHDFRKLPEAYWDIVRAGIAESNSVYLKQLTAEQEEELRGLGFAVFRLEEKVIVVRWPC